MKCLLVSPKYNIYPTKIRLNAYINKKKQINKCVSALVMTIDKEIKKYIELGWLKFKKFKQKMFNQMILY